MTKSLAQLKRLAENPFYAMTPEDKLALQQYEQEQDDKQEEDSSSKKKLSQSGNVTAREIGKIELHPHYPTEE